MNHRCPSPDACRAAGCTGRCAHAQWQVLPVDCATPPRRPRSHRQRRALLAPAKTLVLGHR